MTPAPREHPSDGVVLPNLPMTLNWSVPPEAWGAGEDATLTIEAGPNTDLFVDPEKGSGVFTAPRLLGKAESDFLLSAHVRVDFAAAFDAGVLLLFVDERTWAKLCFEYSPQGRPMVVSVVTRGVSDDCNSFVVEDHGVWLRVARLGAAFAFHASFDGSYWSLVRHFALDHRSDLNVGFLAQSPTGEGCTASFEDIHYAGRRLGDLRSGE